MRDITYEKIIMIDNNNNNNNHTRDLRPPLHVKTKDQPWCGNDFSVGGAKICGKTIGTIKFKV